MLDDYSKFMKPLVEQLGRDFYVYSKDNHYGWDDHV